MRSLLAVVVLVGCGGAQKQANEEAQDFSCKDRVISYIVTKHIAADEIGVQMDCAQHGPRIQRWKIDKQGTRVEDARNITPGAFDDVWRQIAGSGWENLKDCTTGTLGDCDPVYVFDVKDDQNQASFQCQTKPPVPFPYNTLIDALDVEAQKGGQLGDDEPAEMKALDKKDMQR